MRSPWCQNLRLGVLLLPLLLLLLPTPQHPLNPNNSNKNNNKNNRIERRRLEEEDIPQRNLATDGRWNVSPVGQVPVGIRIIIHPWNSISSDLVSFIYACVCTGGGIYICACVFKLYFHLIYHALCAHANANLVPLVHPPSFSLSLSYNGIYRTGSNTFPRMFIQSKWR